MAMENIHMLIFKKYMKGHGKITKSQVVGKYYIIMVINLKANGKMI